jgi:hypothetical protein
MARAAFHPRSRLRDIRERARLLVEDSRDIPRTWGADDEPRRFWSVETLIKFLMLGNIYLILYQIVSALDDPFGMLRSLSQISALTTALLVIASLSIWRSDRRLARRCMIVACAGIASGAWILARFAS